MSERPNITISGGSFQDFVAGDKTVEGDNIRTQNNYYGQSVDLETLSQELDELLQSIEQTHPNVSQDEEINLAIQEINQKPTLKQRLYAALKAGTIEGIKQIGKHPLIQVLIEAIKAAIEVK